MVSEGRCALTNDRGRRTGADAVIRSNRFRGVVLRQSRASQMGEDRHPRPIRSIISPAPGLSKDVLHVRGRRDNPYRVIARSEQARSTTLVRTDSYVSGDIACRIRLSWRTEWRPLRG